MSLAVVAVAPTGSSLRTDLVVFGGCAAIAAGALLAIGHAPTVLVVLVALKSMRLADVAIRAIADRRR